MRKVSAVLLCLNFDIQEMCFENKFLKNSTRACENKEENCYFIYMRNELSLFLPTANALRANKCRVVARRNCKGELRSLEWCHLSCYYYCCCLISISMGIFLFYSGIWGACLNLFFSTLRDIYFLPLSLSTLC